MAAFDLEATYLALDGAGGVRAYPGATPSGAARTPIASSANPGDGDGREGPWPHWEMHPAGDEVLVALQGQGRLQFEHPDGRTQFHDLAAGDTLVVRQGLAPSRRPARPEDAVHHLRRRHDAQAGGVSATPAHSLDATLGGPGRSARRQVINLLPRAADAGGELARAVGLAPPAMSRHLRTLRQCGLVEESSPEFDARVRVYALRAEPMIELLRCLRRPNGCGAPSSPPSATICSRIAPPTRRRPRKTRTLELPHPRGPARAGQPAARLRRLHRRDRRLVASQRPVPVHPPAAPACSASSPGRPVLGERAASSRPWPAAWSRDRPDPRLGAAPPPGLRLAPGRLRAGPGH